MPGRQPPATANGYGRAGSGGCRSTQPGPQCHLFGVRPPRSAATAHESKNDAPSHRSAGCSPTLYELPVDAGGGCAVRVRPTPGSCTRLTAPASHGCSLGAYRQGIGCRPGTREVRRRTVGIGQRGADHYQTLSSLGLRLGMGPPRRCVGCGPPPDRLSVRPAAIETIAAHPNPRWCNQAGLCPGEAEQGSDKKV